MWYISLGTAKICLDEKLYGPFVDTLFSASELAIQSILLFQPLGPFSRRQSHDKTADLFRDYTSLGNLDIEYWNHYKRLHNLRLKGRYLNDINEAKFQ